MKNSYIKNSLPTRERLVELVSYEPETGCFRWLVRRGSVNAGDLAGCFDYERYWRIRVDGVNHRAHRLAFVIMTGECPAEIDHINRDRADNRWVNLRPATTTQNHGNKGMQRNNTSGVKGVCWNRQRGKWQASIQISGRPHYLGLFDNTADAAEAYRVAAVAAFGEFANPGSA